MVTEGQAKKLRRLLDARKSISQAARMTGMDRKTASKYRDNPFLPTAARKSRVYRTRTDPFCDVWPQVEQKLNAEPKLKPYALFDWLQQTDPGRFPDATRRTFERRVARWKALQGPHKTVMIEQIHKPGQFAASDFTVANSLGVRIAGSTFDHTLFHCVLTYSNYESVTLCHSESFEALSLGVQNAFFEFGGVPNMHRTDSLAAAIRNHSSRKQLTERYQSLMDYYNCEAQHTNARCANENGDVESLNGKLKDRIDQALLLRGSRDFVSVEAYVSFVNQLVERANRNRLAKLREDQAALATLPAVRIDTDDYLMGIRVSKHSTIHVRSQTYSVPSRLIGTQVNVRVTVDSILVSVGDVVVETMPRLIGKLAAAINYRHIIESLVRKPGAFANYRYHEQMFPRTIFRVTYDLLGKQHSERVRDRNYLQILHLAATESEQAVTTALTFLIDNNQPIDVEQVRCLVAKASELPRPTDVEVPDVELSGLDELIFLSSPSDDKECHDGAIENKPSNDCQETVHASEQTSEFADNIAAEREALSSISGATSAELPRSLRDSSPASDDRELIAHGVSFGVDNFGDRGTPAESCATVDDEVEATSGQDVVELRLQSVAAACDAEVGDASRGSLLERAGERVAVRQARLGKESRTLRTCGAIDSSRKSFG